MSLLVSGSSEKNFFDENPEFRLITLFKEFEKVDSKASQIMWGIYYLEDPNSKLYRIKDKEERKNEIEKNLIHTKVDWDKYQKYIDAYSELTLNDSQRSFKIWREKARALDKYVEGLNFDTNSELLIKLFKEAKYIWATLDEIQKRIDEEESKTIIKGQGQLSSRDKRFQ